MIFATMSKEQSVRISLILAGLISGALAICAFGADRIEPVPSLATRLNVALTADDIRNDPTSTWCVKAFREQLPEATDALRTVPVRGDRSTTKVVWVVSENGGMSYLDVVQVSPSGDTYISARDDDDPVDRTMSPARSRKLNALWSRAMTGNATDVRDIADGSCTLLSDGTHSRIFLPGKGVPGTDGDAITQTLHLVIDALDD